MVGDYTPEVSGLKLMAILLLWGRNVNYGNQMVNCYSDLSMKEKSLAISLFSSLIFYEIYNFFGGGPF